jgi:predicted nucleic acid-binding protein
LIVADINLVAYLLIGGAQYPVAESVFRKDPDWVAPILWRSEFRSVLASYLRRGHVDLAAALEYMARAESLLEGGEHVVASDSVLALADASRCTAYDCEFVQVALALDVRLVTFDAQVLAAFPDVAVAPADFIG